MQSFSHYLESSASMAENEKAENSTRSTRSASTSGDVPVDMNVEIDSFKGTNNGSSDVEVFEDEELFEDAEEDHGGSDDETELTVDCSVATGSSTSSGDMDRNWSNENIVPEEPTTSNQLAKSGGAKHHNPLATLAAKIFDEKVPLKKKLKWLNRLATVKRDGTVQFEVPGDIKAAPLELGTEVGHGETTAEQVDSSDIQDLPPMQIVMLIVGTRGDVQPFVAIGKRLQEYGHRVRLATHRNFKEFVLSSGLEFFPLGGDPKVLAG